MKMFSAGGGLGMGVKDFIVVFVFHTEKAMTDFQQSGWDFSGQADANAETSTQGAVSAPSVQPGRRKCAVRKRPPGHRPA